MFKRLLVLALFCLPAFSQPSTHPNVRAITAFVKLDRANYAAQLDDTYKFLQAAKEDYTKAGWNVQTIRITTQPFPDYIRGLSSADAVKLLYAIDAWCAERKVDLNIGPAVMHKGDPLENLDILGELLINAKTANASALVATKEGINWPAIHAAAKMLKDVSERSPHGQGTFQFAATAMIKPGTPFYPASYHLGAGHQFAVGLEGAGVVEKAFAQSGGDPERARALLLQAWDAELTQAESVAKQVSARSTWEYLGIDPTPPPLMDVSIGAAMEAFTGQPFGSSGTMTAAGIITSAVKATHVKQIGYAGLMLPVLEDKQLSQRWTEGHINIDSLLAYSAVCATGLDTVPLPGDVTAEQIAKIYGDVATLAFKWNKPLTARLQPMKGKHAGDMTEYSDPYLNNVKLQPLP
jgi:uncharacterized protein (UPF0210 family)